MAAPYLHPVCPLHSGERLTQYGVRYAQALGRHEDIDTVVFRGYEDEERKLFLERLAEVYARKQAAN